MFIIFIFTIIISNNFKTLNDKNQYTSQNINSKIIID